jgi:hypothetical protein
MIIESGGNGSALVKAQGGGAGADGIGGSASVFAGDVQVQMLSTSNGTSAADLNVFGADGAGDNDGGNATLETGKITISGTTAGTSSVTVQAGDADGSGTDSNGGVATVVATAIQLSSTAGTTDFDVLGGDGGGTSGNAGLASVAADSVSVTSGTVASTFTIQAGVATLGAGAAASLISSGDVTVTSADTANAQILVTATSSNSGNLAGTSALLNAKKLTIQADDAGDASVNITSGASFGTGAVGNVSVTLSDLVLQGADDEAGSASLNAVALGAGTNQGKRSLLVTGDARIQSGDGGTGSSGGGASTSFDNATIRGALSVVGGEDGTGSYTGGDVWFGTAETLKAKTLNIGNGGTGDLDFYAGLLSLADNDTAINLDGSDYYTGAAVALSGYSAGDGVYIQSVDYANNRTLSIFSKNGGSIKIDSIDASNKRGTFYAQSPADVHIDSLDISDGVFTVMVDPSVGDGDASMIVGTLDATDSLVMLASPTGNFAQFDRHDTFDVIRATSLTGDPVVVVDQSRMGQTVEYLISYDASGNSIEVTYLGERAHPVMKSLSEGIMASQAFLNRGSDFVAGEGIANAVFATADTGFSMFSSFAYGQSRYNTGSHVDVKGLSLLLGGGYGVDVSFGRFTIAAFFELGDGEYDSYNDFTAYGTVKGKGDVNYAGGGILARVDFGQSDSGSTYVEASGRAGRASVDYRSDDLPWSHRYDFDSTYYGFHVGVGHVFNVTDSTSIDLYGKWLFTHQGGNDVTINNTHVRFDDVNSHRLRAGLRVTTAITDTIKPYFGAAYEHEMDAKAKATVSGHPIDVPDLKGGTGIGELGLSILAAERLNLDLGVQGYAGTRQGVSGGFRLTYNF